MVKIRDLGVSSIHMAGNKVESGTQCFNCADGTTCGDPSGCDDKDKDKDKDKDSRKKKRAKRTSPFNDAAVAQLKQQLRQRLNDQV
jgi:hypothetical protein